MLDWGIINRSETIAPLLINLYDAHRLYELAEDKSPKSRKALVDTVSELLDTDLSLREEDLVSDVLVTLIRQAELDLRKTLADRLADMPKVPHQLVLQLAYDEISVAEKVLERSVCLETLDLMYIIQSHDAPYWRAIARRKAMPVAVMDALSEADDHETHLELASNQFIKLSDYAAEKLTDHAQEHDDLAEVLAHRKELCKELADKIYRRVGDAIKEQVVEATTDSEVIEAVSGTIDDVVLEFADAEQPKEQIDYTQFLPSDFAIQEAIIQGESGELSARTLIESLRAKKMKSFVAQFSTLAGLYPEQALKILKQPYGHGLAIVSKAHNIEKTDFIKMFLLSECFRNQDGHTHSKVLNRAIGYYERLTVAVARRLMS